MASVSVQEAAGKIAPLKIMVNNSQIAKKHLDGWTEKQKREETPEYLRMLSKNPKFNWGLISLSIVYQYFLLAAPPARRLRAPWTRRQRPQSSATNWLLWQVMLWSVGGKIPLKEVWTVMTKQEFLMSYSCASSSTAMDLDNPQAFRVDGKIRGKAFLLSPWATSRFFCFLARLCDTLKRD